MIDGMQLKCRILPRMRHFIVFQTHTLISVDLQCWCEESPDLETKTAVLASSMQMILCLRLLRVRKRIHVRDTLTMRVTSHIVSEATDSQIAERTDLMSQVLADTSREENARTYCW